METTTAVLGSPVGPLLARASGGQLVELGFLVRPLEDGVFQEQADTTDTELLRRLEQQLREYFSRRRRDFDVPLQMSGSQFHRRVWSALCEIPYGATMSYGALAARLGATVSARAVGSANAANPIAIIVPCHRVIGADGSLVGYGGGLERKRMLLDLESGAEHLTLDLPPASLIQPI